MFEKIIRKYGAVKKYDTAVCRKPSNPTFCVKSNHHIK